MFPTKETNQRGADFLLAAQGELHLQAHQLVERFRDIRASLLQDQQAAAVAKGLADNRKPDRVWAPLMFRVQEKQTYLYLEWFFTAPGRERGQFHKSRVPKFAGKGVGGNYDIRTLLANAPEFLHDLVRETETEARYIRSRLRLLGDTKRLVVQLFSAP